MCAQFVCAGQEASVKFTRRHTRALATGAAATAAYLAGAKLSDSRVIRAGSLLALALTATVSAQRASATALTTKKRLDQHVADTAAAVHFVAHGGTIPGAVTVSSLATGGGAISTSGGNVTCGAITTSGQISMGGSLVMNNHDAFTFGHITANQIGPGSDRAPLGSFGTNNLANLNAVAARCDYLLAQDENAGICY
jgi:hypothetical protein